MSGLELKLRMLETEEPGRLRDVGQYSLPDLGKQAWEWDRVVTMTHVDGGHCWYSGRCLLNIYVRDGVVLREEQAPYYPERKDPLAPDQSPGGCQKGICYSHLTYEANRVKYPLKRVGARGEGKWQRISWDQALTEIADKVIDTVTKYGPQAIVDCGGSMTLGTSNSWVYSFFADALGIPFPSATVDEGDDHQGGLITCGTVNFEASLETLFYSDIVLIWAGNPIYTYNAIYHYITEARYGGARVIAITPDYSPSVQHTDLWVPIKMGTDAALALAMAQVVLQEGLHKPDFIREQTDLPFLVLEDSGKFLRESDIKRGGKDNTFYVWDAKQGRAVEAPRKTLALNGLVPALEGEYTVGTLRGRKKVVPVMELLRRKLNSEYTPEKVSPITGIHPDIIRYLAREVATHNTQCLSQQCHSKFYHGDLMERAILLLFALCGHIGRKGATYHCFPTLFADTSVGDAIRHADEILFSVMANDPRYASWREDGWTDEMIVFELTRQAFAANLLHPTTMFFYVHSDLGEWSKKYNSWDPHLKRKVADYLAEALSKGWQKVHPEPSVEPKMLFNYGGSFMRRVRGTEALVKSLLPKIETMVVADFRLGSTGMYADYVLPVAGWYEKWSMWGGGMATRPYPMLSQPAVPPLYEAKDDWQAFVLLAQRIAQRARERRLDSYAYKGVDGRERRLVRMGEAVTCSGLYGPEDAEAVARDSFMHSTNIVKMEWEEFKEKAITELTGVGKSSRAIGNATDVTPGEPIVSLTYHTEKKQIWPTLTRRMQFYIDHDWFLELGEALPVHKDSPKAGGDYPLQMTGGHTRWSTHSCHINQSLLLQLQRGEPLMFMSAEDAASRDIKDGDLVEVYNDVGTFQIHVGVAPTVRPGQVIIYHGWENFQFPGWKHFKSVQASPLNPIELVAGYFQISATAQTGYPGHCDRDTRVEVRKASSA